MQHLCCVLYPPPLLNATPMLRFFGWPSKARELAAGLHLHAVGTATEGSAPARSTGRLTLTGCRGPLDRVQHPMARDRVVERGAEMCSLAIVAGEPRVRLGDVGGRAVQRREPVLLRHGQGLERRLRAVAA